MAALAGVDPIQNVESQPVATAGGGLATAEQVKRAIMAAGTLRNWQMSESGPGTLRGVYAARNFSAEVKISYSATDFSIHYANSSNLKYSTKKQGVEVIHGNYNKWVANLRADSPKLLPYFSYCGNRIGAVDPAARPPCGLHGNNWATSSLILVSASMNLSGRPPPPSESYRASPIFSSPRNTVIFA